MRLTAATVCDMTEEREQDSGRSEEKAQEESEQKEPSPPPAPAQPLNEEPIDLTELGTSARQAQPDRDD